MYCLTNIVTNVYHFTNIVTIVYYLTNIVTNVCYLTNIVTNYRDLTCWMFGYLTIMKLLIYPVEQKSYLIGICHLSARRIF